jgi:hypothetical protein
LFCRLLVNAIFVIVCVFPIGESVGCFH